MIQTTQFIIQNTLIVNQITLFGNQMTQTLYFAAFMTTVEKMVSYVLGEHRVGRQLKMGEHQAKCRALKSSIVKLDLVNCKCRSTFAQSVVTSFQRSSPSQISPRLAQDH